MVLRETREANLGSLDMYRGKMMDMEKSRDPGFRILPFLPFQSLDIFVLSTMPQYTQLYK